MASKKSDSRDRSKTTIYRRMSELARKEANKAEGDEPELIEPNRRG
ncbi:hypothetical protein [Salinisphaera hydrothermalis]